jgi:hypothetical protein
LIVGNVPWLPLVSLPSMSSELTPSASNAMVASAAVHRWTVVRNIEVEDSLSATGKARVAADGRSRISF